MFAEAGPPRTLTTCEITGPGPRVHRRASKYPIFLTELYQRGGLRYAAALHDKRAECLYCGISAATEVGITVKSPDLPR